MRSRFIFSLAWLGIVWFLLTINITVYNVLGGSPSVAYMFADFLVTVCIAFVGYVTVRFSGFHISIDKVVARILE